MSIERKKGLRKNSGSSLEGVINPDPNQPTYPDLTKSAYIVVDFRSFRKKIAILNYKLSISKMHELSYLNSILGMYN